jgi:hypothetical protein
MIKIMSLVSALQMLSNSSRVNNAAGSRTQKKNLEDLCLAPSFRGQKLIPNGINNIRG